MWRSREPLPSLNIASLTTDSIAALRAYLQGERYYRRFALDSALAAYTRAVEVDSTFALAHLRRALVYGWTGGYGSPASHQAAAAGFRFAGRLPPRSRRLLEGYRAFEEGSPRAIDSMRAYVDRVSRRTSRGGTPTARRSITSGSWSPIGPDTIIAAFDKVIAGDSTLTPAVIHPLELTLMYRDSARFNRYLRLFERTAPPGHVAAHRVAAPARLGAGAERQRAPGGARQRARTSDFMRWSPPIGDETATSDTVLARLERLRERPAGQLAGAPLRTRSAGASRWSGSAGCGRSRSIVDTVAAVVTRRGRRDCSAGRSCWGSPRRPSAGAKLDSLLATGSEI